MLEQVNTFNTLEKRKKKIQFVSVFHTLIVGRLMNHYQSLEELYAFLDVPNLPRMQWMNWYGWMMGEFIYKEVQSAI